MKTSKTLLAAAMALLLCASCDILGFGFTNGPSRSDTESSYDGYNDSGPSGQGDLYYVAVSVPQGYDWQRDSAAGTIDAKLILYKNQKPLLSLDCSPSRHISTDPDSHHLIGGKLYTEYSDADSTYIKCNGSNFLQFAGREYLKALLEKDGEVWTLGQNRGAEGFCVRCNGRVVMKRSTGTLFGDMSSSPHQAMYEQDGKLCYVYLVREESGSTVCYNIDYEDFRESFGTRGVLDACIIEGKRCVAYNENKDSYILEGESKRRVDVFPSGLYLLREACLFGSGDGFCLLGDMASSEVNEPLAMLYKGGKFEFFPADDPLYVYPCASGTVFLLRRLEGGGHWLYMPEKSVYLESGYRFFTRNALWTDGELYYMALNPEEQGEKPSVVWPEGEQELDIYGYLSCVEFIPTQ